MSSLWGIFELRAPKSLRYVVKKKKINLFVKKLPVSGGSYSFKSKHCDFGMSHNI